MARGAIIKRYWKDGKRFSYAIKYRLPDGRQKLETIGPNKKEAERALEERMRQLNRGTYTELPELTFKDFAQKWMDEHAEPSLKPSTLVGYRSVLRNHLVPTLGHLRLKQITAAMIRDHQLELRGTGRKAKTVNTIHGLFAVILNTAVKWEYLAVSPFVGVDRLRVPREEMRVLTPDEVRRLLQAVPEQHRLIYIVAVHCGLRSKTSRRRVDLTDTAYAALRSRFEAEEVPEEDSADLLIFKTASGRPLDPGYVTSVVRRRALEAAGLPQIRFHDLRHTYASLLIAAKENVKYIQAQLGHSSITMTLDLYGHLMPELYGHGGGRLEKLLNGKPIE